MRMNWLHYVHHDPVFISVGSPTVEGQWVDAKGMFLGGAHAGPFINSWEKMDLGTMDFPPIETALTDGEIAFRQHSGGHTTGPNWPYFPELAEPVLQVKKHRYIARRLLLLIKYSPPRHRWIQGQRTQYPACETFFVLDDDFLQ